LSYPAKAGYPARCSLSMKHWCLWNTGSSALVRNCPQGGWWQHVGWVSLRSTHPTSKRDRI